MADPITDYYGSEPWSAISNKQRDWYVPALLWAYKQRSTYGAMVPVKVDFSAMSTKTMIFSGMWELEPNWNALQERQIWLDTMHPASWQQRITVDHYGGKIAIHRWDPVISYWESTGRNPGALVPLARTLLASAVIDQMEIQIRNTFQKLPMTFFSDGQGGFSGTGFADIAETDVYDPDVALELNLDFDYSEVYNPQVTDLQAVAYTTPGVIYDIKKSGNSSFKSAIEYRSDRRLLSYEVGDYMGVAHVKHPINTLYNHGAITAQAPISAAVNAGDGAPDPNTTKVHGILEVGEKSNTNITHYIQLGSFGTGSISDFEVGDIITIHAVRSAGTTAPYTVQYAPMCTDGFLSNRQIVSIDTDNGRICVDQPIQKELTTDLGGGVYGYVTKGLHVHQSTIVAAPGAVVGGFAVPPGFHTPPTIDDVMAMIRFAWDGYYEYSVFRHNVAAVVYSSGHVSKMGYKGTGA